MPNTTRLSSSRTGRWWSTWTRRTGSSPWTTPSRSCCRERRNARCHCPARQAAGGHALQAGREEGPRGADRDGHVGLTPQTATALGGYRSQGRTADRALEVTQDALALEEAGCFAIVFEAVPSDLTEAVVPRLEVPVIGIGAGPDTDGQVLVFHDLLGIYDGHVPRFAKRFADVKAEMVAGVAQYTDEVRRRAFPGPEHTYSIDEDELASFRSEW